MQAKFQKLCGFMNLFQAAHFAQRSYRHNRPRHILHSQIEPQIEGKNVPSFCHQHLTAFRLFCSGGGGGGWRKLKMQVRCIVWFQKISILPPQKGLEFPGGGGFYETSTFKEMYEA